MVGVKLYVEGGGGSKALKRECRKGFGKFLERAGLAGMRPRVVACGSRNDAYDRFKTAHAQSDGLAMLLVDAEDPVTAQGTWQHLQTLDGWSRPAGATDDQCHLMVQVMESWFLADVDALESFYGQGFRPGPVSGIADIEAVSKQDVLSHLGQAAAGTGKSAYRKGKHSFQILAMLDAVKVKDASPHADRFIKALLE